MGTDTWWSMSEISLCGTDPKAFLRSVKVNDSGRPFALALSRMAFRERICSKTPAIPDRKPFCRFESIMPLFSRYCSRREAMILWNNLPIVEVRAIGRKFAGTPGSPPLWTRWSSPLHQRAGAWGLFKMMLEYSVARK